MLYGVADTEHHFFVDADAQKDVRRVLWIQFEAFLPGVPDHYTYEPTRTIAHHGVDFIVDTGAYRHEPSLRRKGSDDTLFRAFLEGAGYRLPSQYFYARWVHLPDTARRQELMIVALEDLTPYGFSDSDFDPGGKAVAQWPAVERAFLDRGAAAFSLRREAS